MGGKKDGIQSLRAHMPISLVAVHALHDASTISTRRGQRSRFGHPKTHASAPLQNLPQQRKSLQKRCPIKTYATRVEHLRRDGVLAGTSLTEPKGVRHAATITRQSRRGHGRFYSEAILTSPLNRVMAASPPSIVCRPFVVLIVAKPERDARRNCLIKRQPL